MRVRAVSAIAIVALVASACSASGGTGGTLEGTTWLMKSYDNGTSMVDVPDGVYPDSVFADGKVSGILACNSYTGGYTQSDSSLTISELATTMMACPDTSSGVEAEMSAALQKAATYTASSTSLKIYDSSGKNVLVYQAAPADTLSGTSWTATGVNNGQGAVQSVAAGTSITASFGTDGQLSGSGGCNQYTATYTSADGTVVIGPVAGTRMACDPAVSDQETAYFAALDAAATYAISGGKLELRDASGAIQVTYAKQ
ncbi:MAG: META domain-containing protein [Chloroflexi bacterium]|nr:META domain-containing protein [Chloroflexota bacterium]